MWNRKRLCFSFRDSLNYLRDRGRVKGSLVQRLAKILLWNKCPCTYWRNVNETRKKKNIVTISGNKREIRWSIINYAWNNFLFIFTGASVFMLMHIFLVDRIFLRITPSWFQNYQSGCDKCKKSSSFLPIFWKTDIFFSFIFLVKILKKKIISLRFDTIFTFSFEKLLRKNYFAILQCNFPIFPQKFLWKNLVCYFFFREFARKKSFRHFEVRFLNFFLPKNSSEKIYFATFQYGFYSFFLFSFEKLLGEKSFCHFSGRFFHFLSKIGSEKII